MGYYKGFRGYIAYKNAKKYRNVNKEKNRLDDKNEFIGHENQIHAFQHFALHEYGVKLSIEDASHWFGASHVENTKFAYHNENIYGIQNSQQREETRIFFADMYNEFHKRKDNIYKWASRDQKRWRANKNCDKTRSRDRDQKQSDYM